MKKLSLFTLLFIFVNLSVFSQLDKIHYLAPLKTKSESNNQILKESEIILSTPSLTNISVTVTRGDGTAMPGSPYTVSKGSPFTITLAYYLNELSVSNSETGVVITGKGLKFESSTDFLVTYKAKNKDYTQADLCVAKGKTALWNHFKWCGFPINIAQSKKSSYLGIFATEDSTEVKIGGYNPACVFRDQSDEDGITSDSIEVFLNNGECYVLECVSTADVANVNGFIGANITSTKKNCGQ